MKIHKLSVNPDILKIIALITMTIDHLYKIVFPDAPEFFIMTEMIGRIAMPVFSGLIMYHLATKKIFKKYLCRLIIFGLLAVILFFPFQYNGHSACVPLNILITFAYSILTIGLIEYIQKHTDVAPYIRYLFSLLVILLLLPFSALTEYSFNGFCFLLCFYFYYSKPNVYRLVPLALAALYLNRFGIGGFCSLLTTLFIVNTDRTKTYPRLIKHWYTFYIYYPLHRVLFYAIAYLIFS